MFLEEIVETFEERCKQVVIIELDQPVGLTFENYIDMVIIDRVDLEI